MLGYDVEEEQRDFQQNGFTGEVTRYSEGSMQYPCVIISAPFEKYKLEVLKTMLAGNRDISETDVKTYLYFEEAGNRVALGVVVQTQVRAILSLFEGDNIKGYYTDKTPLTGDMIYVLA